MADTIPTPTEVGTPTTLEGETFHRIEATRARFGVSKSTWWRWVQDGFAPAPLRPSPGVTVWRSSDLDAFALKLIEKGAA